MKGRDYTVAVDLGEGKVRVAAAFRENNGALSIAALAEERTEGIKLGRIENSEDVSAALARAVALVEKRISSKIDRLYCGISGEFVYMVQHEESIAISDVKGRSSIADFDKLEGYMQLVKPAEGFEILDFFMHSTTVDSRRAYKKLVGNYGKQVGACYNFVMGENDAIERVKTLLEDRSIKLKEMISSAGHFGEAVVSSEAMEGGVAVVDLGKGITNVAIYYNGVLCYSISIPVGSDVINRDLASLNINKNDIERVKCDYGCAVKDNVELKVLAIEGRRADSPIKMSDYNLALIIEERVKNIVKFVEREIRDAGFADKLAYGVVLTGGGAKLRDIDELFRRHLPYDVEIGNCSMVLASRSVERYRSEEYATLIGLLLRGTALDRDAMEHGCYVPCVTPLATAIGGGAAVGVDIDDEDDDDVVVAVPRTRPAAAAQRTTQSRKKQEKNEGQTAISFGEPEKKSWSLVGAFKGVVDKFANSLDTQSSATDDE
ncbi:MAG: cell division protein FtsA [Rikenellaceae bacterium]